MQDRGAVSYDDFYAAGFVFEETLGELPG